MMRRAIPLAAFLLLAIPSTTYAGGNDPPPIDTPDPPAPPEGPTTVNYFENGLLQASTEIPSGSAFYRGGGGGGGAPQPCLYLWEPPDPDGDGPELPPGVQPAPSFEWDFQEIDPDADAWDDYDEDIYETIRTNFDPRIPGIDDALPSDRYIAETQPLDTAYRRFEAACEGDDGEYTPLDYIDVYVRDPFWDPWSRLDELFNSVQIDAFAVGSVPDDEPYGGWVIWMPTWLQISTDAWQPYISAVDVYRGWRSRLILFPAQLEFLVATDAGTRPITCKPEDGVPDAAWTPARPGDLIDFWDLGPLDEECVWVPDALGEVTIRARITYDVVFDVSGYTTRLDPYEWMSDPLTMTVGELRAVNVNEATG